MKKSALLTMIGLSCMSFLPNCIKKEFVKIQFIPYKDGSYDIIIQNQDGMTIESNVDFDGDGDLDRLVSEYDTKPRITSQRYFERIGPNDFEEKSIRVLE